MMQAPAIAVEMHKAHLARVRRIEAAAIPEKIEPVVVAAPPPAPPPPPKSWEDRQREIPLPKPHWFSIVSMSDFTPPEPKYPLVEDIQRVTCRYFTITRNDLLSPRRDKRVAHPRQIAMYLAKTLTIKSLPDIGRRFRRADHTTPLHAYRKIERLVKSDWTVAYDVAHLEAML